MRRFLAILMTLVMIMSVVPVSAETAGNGTKLVNDTYTQPISRVKELIAGYAIFLQDGEICSDQQLEEPIGDAEKGDIVLAESRKGFGTANDRVKVTWACKGKVRTGWVAAEQLRLMDKSEVKAYEKKAQKNKQAVREGGKFLLNIDAYKAPAEDNSARSSLPATTITSLKTTSKGLNIQWKAIEGATKYQVFRSTKKSTGFKRVATVTTTSYVDTGAKRNTGYYYYIKGVNADGGGEKSATKGRYNDFGPAVKFKRAADGTVTISWAAKTNAVSYALYRANDGETSYKKIATVKTGTSYVDKSAANGKTYSYYLVANYKVNGVAMTGTQGGRKSYTYGVTKPESVAAANVAAGARISWNAVDGATGYRVFYRASETAAWTLLTTTKATVKYFTHRTPAYGQKIQYAVRTQGKLNGKTVYAPYAIVDHVAVGQVTDVELFTYEDGVMGVGYDSYAAKGATGVEVHVTMPDGTEEVYDREVGAEGEAFFYGYTAGEYSAYVVGYCEIDGQRWYGRPSVTVTLDTEGFDTSVVPVMNYELSSTPNMLNVSWNPVKDALGYIINVEGEGWAQQFEAGANATSMSIPVNEGMMWLHMCAVFAEGWGPECIWQDVHADWPNGLRLTAPVVTVKQSDEYNKAELSWQPVTGATTYQIMVLQGEWGEFPGPDGNGVTVTLNGNGDYEVLVRAEALLSNGKVVVGPWYEAVHTFQWSEDESATPIAKVEVSETPNYIDVSWKAVDTAEKYYVQVFGQNGDWELEYETTQTSISIPVNGGEEIDIYVCSVVNGQYSDPAVLEIFTYWDEMVALTKPTLTYEMLSEPEVRLSWEMIPGASSYFLAETRSDGEGTLHEVYDTSRTVTLIPGLDYEFSVFAMHYDGPTEIVGPRSNSVSFTAEWEGSLKLDAPVVTVDMSEPNVITYNWDAVEGAEYYDIRLSSEAGIVSETTTGEYYMLVVNGDSTEYNITVRAAAVNPETGKTVYSQAGTASARAHWADGVCLVKPAMGIYANSYNEETDLVEMLAVWELVEGAEGYVLDYCEQGGSVTSVEITDSDSYGFELPKGKTYEFAVQPYFTVNGVRVYGPASGWVTCVALYGVQTLTAPEMTLTTGEDYDIIVTWKQIESAFSYTITYGKVGEEPTEQYLEAWTGEDWDIPVTSWSFKAEPGATYQVSMCANWEEDGEIEHGPVCATQTITAEEEEVGLTAPVMTVSAAEHGYLNISWEPVAGATKYRIFYKESTASGYSNMYVDGAETSVKIPAVNNTSYKVYMRAINVSAFSGVTTSGPTCVTQTVSIAWSGWLAAPQVTITRGEKGVLNVSWNAVAGAAGYMLSYKKDSESIYNDIALSADTLSYDLTVTPETTYNLRVYAFEGDPTLPYAGLLSPTQTYFATWIPVLTTPVMELSQGGMYRLNITWEPVDFATNYRIFYKESTASGYTNVLLDASETSYTLQVKNDATYTVYMRALHVDADGTTTSGPKTANQSVYVHWEEPTIITPDLTVTPVEGDASNTMVAVSWTKPNPDYSYTLYIRQQGDEAFDSYDVTDHPEETFNVWLPTGTQWEFQVEASLWVDDQMFLGEPSEIVTITAAYGYYALTAPEMSLAMGEEGYIDVTLGEQTFADYFVVYVREVGAAEFNRWEIPASLGRCSYQAIEGVIYEFYATAAVEEADGSLREGPACETKNIMAIFVSELPVPTATIKTEFNGAVTVTWNNIGAANVVEARYRKVGTQTYSVQGADLTVYDKDYLSLRLEPQTAYELYLMTYYELDGIVYAQEASKTYTFTTLGAPTMAAPQMKLELGQKGYLNISWQPVQNANGYSLFYKKSTDASFTNVKAGGDVTNYLFAVEVGETYTVYMRGIYVDEEIGQTTSGTKCANQTIAAEWWQYRALLIGQTYPGTSSELPGPDMDARSMQTMLNTMTSTPYKATTKYNLTADGILSAIASTFAGADEDSVSLFYYSGHGANAGGGEYQGALCGTTGYVTFGQLRAALDKIPGKKIVLLDSCHSGAHIGKSANGLYTMTKSDLISFNNAAIAAFAAKTRSNLAVNDYYVITASRSSETSQSMSYNGLDYVGLFTYAMLYGSGYDELAKTQISGLYSDDNGDKRITLNEAYTYAYDLALEINPEQHAQVYPVNSSFVMWGR